MTLPANLLRAVESARALNRPRAEGKVRAIRGIAVHVTGLAAAPDVALARIWLMGPGDSCGTCRLASECTNRTTCLHLAASVGITGTPAFLINGRKLTGAQPFAAFKRVIEEELKNDG